MRLARAAARVGWHHGRRTDGIERGATALARESEPRESVIAAKLFVGNLNFNTTRDDLAGLFAEAGEVVDVFIPTDRATGRPRGFAFVEMSSPAAATEAIEKFNGYELAGRELRVNEAQERPRRFPADRPPEFRPRNKGSQRDRRNKRRL